METSLPIQLILSKLQVKLDRGLSGDEVTLRSKQYGKNATYFRKKKRPVVIFISQFLSPLIIVLLLVSVTSIFVGEVIDGTIIIAMLMLNAIIGTVQELKAEKSLEKLAALVVYDAKVLRGGEVVTVHQEDIVPGDIVLLKTGEIVPADCRLLESHSLIVNEATLTGESLPVYKEICPAGEPGSTPQELRGSVFMGTAVVGGYGRAIVTEIGAKTFLGKSVSSKSLGDELTKFERDLKQFSDLLLKFVLIFSGVTAVLNMSLGRDVVTSLMLGITLALGITPEILPIVVTIAMSSGAFALAKKKVIVRRLSALEDLGNVDILCTDKTGTLTTGKIGVYGAYSPIGDVYKELLSMAYLCSASFPSVEEKTTPNPLDAAIRDELPFSLRKVLNKTEIIDVTDFNFDTKQMVSLVALQKKHVMIRKGATEFVLKHCEKVLHEGKETALSKEGVVKLVNVIRGFEDQGFRVISVATETVSEQVMHAGSSNKMTYVGFVVFQDPPRPGIAKEIQELAALHVSTKIITGDSGEVTKQIAGVVGLKVSDEDIVTGKELDTLSDEQFALTALSHTYFVRVTPLHKQRLIEVLRKFGHTVAYLGDGINDVGALRAADVGISVENATPVTKDVSDILLLEKNLSALGDAVTQGRITFSNTIKFITNTMSSSFGNVITAACASLFLPFIPLLPSQLLLIDSLSDVQHLSFATDNVDKNMYQKPRSWDKKFMARFILVFGLLSTVFDFIHIAIFSKVTSNDATMFRTLWFTESVVTEMLATFSVRTTLSMFKSSPSKPLFITTIVTIIIAVVIPFTVIGDTWFGFIPLKSWHFALISAVVILYLIALELTKKWFYSKKI